MRETKKKEHINAESSRANRIIYYIIWGIMKRSELSRMIKKLLLYETLVQPILLYGVEN